MVLASAGNPFSDAQAVLEAVLAIAVIIAAAAGARAVWKNGGSKAALTLQKENNEALRDQNELQKERIAELEHERELRDAQHLADQKAIEALNVRIEDMSQLVQGIQAIADVSRKLDEQHRAVMAAIGGRQ